MTTAPTEPATRSPGTTTVATSIRLPADIHERVAAQAGRNLRSFNSELVAIVTGRSDAIRVDG